MYKRKLSPLTNCLEPTRIILVYTLSALTPKNLFTLFVLAEATVRWGYGKATLSRGIGLADMRATTIYNLCILCLHTQEV